MATNTLATIGRFSEYDAVVVGARAAGAATAMLLGRAGRRVLLVDRSTYGSDTLSTHALLRGGTMQLRRWGLLDAVRDAGTPPITRTRFHYGDEIVDLVMRDQHGVDALYAPRRTVLDPILVDAAIDAGVEVAFGVRVEHLRRDGNGRVVGVVARTPEHREAIAHAAIVIGADGTRSRIARAVDAPVELRAAHASAFIYAYFAEPESNAFDWYYRPGVAGAAIPTNDGLTNVSVGLPPSRFAASVDTTGVEATFRIVLREVAPDLATRLEHRKPMTRFRTFPGWRGYMRRAYGPGWALVGDAGSFKDPSTAHGLTDALRDAELLVRALLDTGDLAAYQATRDMLARPFMEMTAATASYEWDLHGIAALHRQMKALTDEENALIAAFDGAGVVAA
jgi:2-polyprenyl-6-methoxyphenol hydroxylase-like FAD-dependent oxidoreductase